MGNKNSLCFGAYQDGNLVGIALGRIKSWYEGTEYWVEEFGVLPERQQTGIGSEFLRQIERMVAERGISHMALLTDRQVSAYRFYRKNGFEEREDTVFLVKSIL